MSSCYLSTCPPSHRRPRDAMRENWSDLVSEWSPVWPVLVDDRPAVVAPVRDVLVVASADPARADHTIGFDQVVAVSAVRSVVHIMDRGGNCYDFAFSDGADAVRAAKLIEEMRAAACGRWAEEAAVGPDEQPEDLLARRSNGHPTVAGRVVRWVDDLDLDDDALDDLRPAEAAPARPAPQVEAARDVEVHPVPDAAGADPDEADVADAVVEAAAEQDDVAEVPDEAPADERSAPESVDDDRTVQTERPAPPEASAVEISDYPLDDAEWDLLPIEREVAMALAAGLPLDPPPGPAPEPPPPAQDPAPRRTALAEPVLAIPAQAPPPSAESVLLVTTDAVPGRSIALVHGDVLAVVSWPAPGQPGRGVHEAARDRLAQAALQRGGDAVVGLRYGSTGAIGGDVVAYGTAVTLEPPEPAPVAAPAEPSMAGEG